jgi:plasmid replication initiation protein
MNSDNQQLIIRKSNELIESRYKLNLYEHRLILFLACNISPNDKDFKNYEIRISDFIKLFELETDKSAYEKVEHAATNLLSQIVRLQDTETKEMTTWLSYVKYVEGSGVIQLEFHRSLKPYLLQLKERFTQYNFRYVIYFTSQYSIRFYELFKMEAFKAKNGYFEKMFIISELRLILGLASTDYPLFGNLKDRVINPAIKEINEKTDLKVKEVKYGKTGRKITSVTFTVAILSKEFDLYD